LQTGSLLTGQLFVELGMHPDTPIRLADEDVPFPELPTIPASLEQLTTSVKSILAKLEKVDTEKIGAELLANLQEVNILIKGANKVITKPELQETVDDLRESLHAFKKIMSKLDQRIEPITANLEMAIGAGNQALKKTQVTVDLINNVPSPESPLQYRIIELSEELAETARSIRSLVDMLEREPNSIIFDKDSSGDK